MEYKTIYIYIYMYTKIGTLYKLNTQSYTLENNNYFLSATLHFWTVCLMFQVLSNTFGFCLDFLVFVWFFRALSGPLYAATIVKHVGLSSSMLRLPPPRVAIQRGLYGTVRSTVYWQILTDIGQIWSNINKSIKKLTFFKRACQQIDKCSKRIKHKWCLGLQKHIKL